MIKITKGLGNMLVGPPLCLTPALANFDTTRSSMTAKQIDQSVVSSNMEKPYVIAPNCKIRNSDLFTYHAEFDGELLFSDDNIMVVRYNKSGVESQELMNSDDKHIHEDHGNLEIDEDVDVDTMVFSVPEYKHTSDEFAVRIRHKHKQKSFSKGDLLYEYDTFKNGMPMISYNADIGFMAYMGLTFSDSVVVSESFSKKALATEVVSVAIRIGADTKFGNNYDTQSNPFFPKEGDVLTSDILYTEIVDNKPIDTKLPYRNGVVTRCRVHRIIPVVNKANLTKTLSQYLVNISKSINCIDTPLSLLEDPVLRSIIDMMHRKSSKDLLNKFIEIASVTDPSTAFDIVFENYMNIREPKPLNKTLFIVEIDVLFADIPLTTGCKVSSAYANKGIISKIVPDHLMPYNKVTGDRLDIIIGPLSIFSRMIYSPIINILLSKCVRLVEREIIKVNSIGLDNYAIIDDENNIIQLLINIVELIEFCNINSKSQSDLDYIEKCKKLVDVIISEGKIGDTTTLSKYFDDVVENGMHIQYPQFVNISLSKLRRLASDLFEVNLSEKMAIPKEAFERYATSGFDIDEEVVCNKIFSGPNAITRLKQFPNHKYIARSDVGYDKDGIPARVNLSQHVSSQNGGKIGYMETDAIIAHGATNLLKEFRTIQSNIEQYNLSKSNYLSDSEPQRILGYDELSDENHQRIDGNHESCDSKQPSMDHATHIQLLLSLLRQ